MVVAQILLLASSAGLGGLLILNNQLFQASRATLEEFTWLVFVEGDQVAIDQVGRYLHHQEGLKSAHFVSPEETMASLKNDPILANELAGLSSNPFKPCWKINWSGGMFDPSRLNDLASDVRYFPGVIDLAYDMSVLARYYEDRAMLDRVRLVLSVLAFFLITAGVIILGAYLFFAPAPISWTKTDGKKIAVDFIFWSGGYFLIQALMGPLSPFFLLGGPLASSFRILWSKVHF